MDERDDDLTALIENFDILLGEAKRLRSSVRSVLRKNPRVVALAWSFRQVRRLPGSPPPKAWRPTCAPIERGHIIERERLRAQSSAGVVGAAEQRDSHAVVIVGDEGLGHVDMVRVRKPGGHGIRESDHKLLYLARSFRPPIPRQ